jgi:hypothetical protein
MAVPGFEISISAQARCSHPLTDKVEPVMPVIKSHLFRRASESKFDVLNRRPDALANELQ